LYALMFQTRNGKCQYDTPNIHEGGPRSMSAKLACQRQHTHTHTHTHTHGETHTTAPVLPSHS
jgi:hypothetical protein